MNTNRDGEGSPVPAVGAQAGGPKPAFSTTTPGDAVKTSVSLATVWAIRAEIERGDCDRLATLEDDEPEPLRQLTLFGERDEH